MHRRLVAPLFLINKGTLFGYNLNSGNAKRSKSGTPCCSGKRSIRSPHRMLSAGSENLETKSLRISQHKWNFVSKSYGKSRCWTPVELQLKIEESGNGAQVVVNLQSSLPVPR